jgi:hypothetical protein
MSNLVGAALPVNIIARKDRRMVPLYHNYRNYRDRISDRDVPTSYPGGYCNDFWPGNKGFAGGDVAIQEATWSRQMSRLAWGMASRVGFPGVTLDQYGAPLAGVTVILHRTATREYVMEIVSDANGNYLAQSVYAGEGHYKVIHKAGAINVFGASDNNLIGA